jgi:GNAT superfamily N-acetyltransferase
MAWTVRRACVQDLDAMVELLGILFSQEADFAPNPEHQRTALLKILQSPELGTLLVAHDDFVVVGMVSLLYTVSTAEGGAAAWLEDMVVRPQLRHQGLGKRLLSAALDVCRSKGIRRVTLLTDRTNELAQRFYRQHGFADSAMTPMRQRLTE